MMINNESNLDRKVMLTAKCNVSLCFNKETKEL